MPQPAVKRFRLATSGGGKNKNSGPWVQVGRQGNPLFNEALVAVEDKDLYSRTSPSDDAKIIQQVCAQPGTRAAARQRVPAGTIETGDRYRGDLYPRHDQGGSLDRCGALWPAAARIIRRIRMIRASRA